MGPSVPAKTNASIKLRVLNICVPFKFSGFLIAAFNHAVPNLDLPFYSLPQYFKGKIGRLRESNHFPFILNDPGSYFR